jgi:hypothetical protein
MIDGPKLRITNADVERGMSGHRPRSGLRLDARPTSDADHLKEGSGPAGGQAASPNPRDPTVGQVALRARRHCPVLAGQRADRISLRSRCLGTMLKLRPTKRKGEALKSTLNIMQVLFASCVVRKQRLPESP